MTQVWKLSHRELKISDEYVKGAKGKVANVQLG
jgi:hypothetical protein